MPDGECASIIIGDKDRIHRRWFEAQSYPSNIKQNDTTLVRADNIHQIVELSKTALEQSKECEAPAIMTNRLQEQINRIETRLGESEHKEWLGQEYYLMPREVATELFVTDINKLANTVHHIGSSFFESLGESGGCKLGEGEGTRLLNQGVLSYCEGIPNRRGTVRDSGIEVEHHLGQHSAVVKFNEDEDGYDTNVYYAESGERNWEDRQSGVVDKLEEEYGLECKVAGTGASCRGKIRDVNKVREMACFMGRVSDIDLLRSDCVSDAVDIAFDEAKEVNEELGEKAYTSDQGVRPHGDWEVTLDCYNGEDREYDEERRLSRREELQQSLDWAILNADTRRKAARGAPCSLPAYKYIEKAIQHTDAAENCCLRFGSWGLEGEKEECDGRVKEERESNVEAASALTRRCPAEPVILVAEGQYRDPRDFNYQTSSIEKTCTLAEDEACMKALRTAQSHYERLEKPLTLETLLEKKVERDVEKCLSLYNKSTIIYSALNQGLDATAPLEELCGKLLETRALMV